MVEKKDIKNLDMFKVVEEIEKQKKVTIDDIYDELDLVKDDAGKVKDVEIKKDTGDNDSIPSVKPSIPNNIGGYDTRFDAFRKMIENVNYTGKSDYNNGHKAALEKYYKEAYRNMKDLYLVEARLNDEISRFESHESIYDKGYYDGLFYVLRAVRKSRDLLLKKISIKLDEELR